MPANLNALIRYKQIDLCLKNLYLKATIEVMQERCSEQLGEYRGVYKLVSERTIRDDIRTMRSDALGFNAPIIVKDGVYRYADENYSIFNTSISEMDLLKDVIKLLLEERENIKSPKLNGVLADLSRITGITIEAERGIKIDLSTYIKSPKVVKFDKNSVLESINMGLLKASEQLNSEELKKHSERASNKSKIPGTSSFKQIDAKQTRETIDLRKFDKPKKSIMMKIQKTYSWEYVLEIL